MPAAPKPATQRSAAVERHDDKAFFHHHWVLCRALNGERLSQAEVRRAATVVAEFALRTNDEGAWAFLLARAREFRAQRRPIPIALIDAILARVPPRRARGRPAPSLFEREIRRTQASVVATFRAGTTSDERALAMAEESPALPAPKSVQTLKRSVQWAVKQKGAKKSE